jgi:CBS domain-containing protein
VLRLRARRTAFLCAIPDPPPHSRPTSPLLCHLPPPTTIPTKPKPGALIGNLSASDLRGLAADEFAQLLLPVGEYVLVRHGLAPAPAAGADWAAALKALPVVTVTEATTFTELLALLVAKHLHRVYVVNGDGKPVSIITLTDVLRAVTK